MLQVEQMGMTHYSRNEDRMLKEQGTGQNIWTQRESHKSLEESYISIMISIPGQEMLVFKWWIRWPQYVAHTMEEKQKVTIGLDKGT